MLIELKNLFPNTKTMLVYTNSWELLVSVVLSAQCTDKRVNMVTQMLFKKYKKLDDYLKVSQEEFEKDIFSTGFYRNKAKNILAAAKIVKNNFNGKVPHTMDELLTIPGVARKTANVIQGQAFGISEGMAVDTHVRRFAIKFDLTNNTNPVKIEKDLMELVPQEDWHFFSSSLVRYGQEICPANKHSCETHPLSKIYPKAGNIWPKSK